MSLREAALALETRIGQDELTSMILIAEGDDLHIYTSGAPANLIGTVAAMLDSSPELIDLFVDALLIMKRAGREYSGLDRIAIAGELNH